MLRKGETPWTHIVVKMDIVVRGNTVGVLSSEHCGKRGML